MDWVWAIIEGEGYVGSARVTARNHRNKQGEVQENRTQRYDRDETKKEKAGDPYRRWPKPKRRDQKPVR
jgi:hypothetical protein